MKVVRNIVRLEDVTTRIGDGLHGTPKYDESGEYYFINGNNLSDGKIEVKTDTKRITAEEYNKIKRELSERTILLAINGTIGNLGFYNGERVALGKSACYLNLRENVDKHYIRYVLEHSDFQEYALAFATGATIKNLGLKAVRDYKFHLPPLPTQRRIASILSAYDDLIENNLKRIKLLEELAQRTYEEWFVKFRINGEQLALDEKTGLPVGWKRKKITDFISFTQDKEKVKKFDNELVYLATADVDGTQITGKGELITWENKPSRAQKRLIKESVWFARMSNTYKVILATRNFKKDYVISSGFVGFRPKNSNCLPFLFCLIKSDDFHSKKDLFATGATQVSLNDISLSTIEIVEPSIAIIEMFGKKFIDNLELRQNLIDQNQNLKESRDILLPRLMSGQINVE